jgi:two-component system, chemotaxis family, chemotaxis protein CheY
MLDGYGKRVLAVEDNESALICLVSLLDQAGYNVLAATDGQSALEEMYRRHFDVVITDYHMPRLDGVAFLLRSRKMWPETPVLLTSGDNSDMPEIAARSGAYAWIRKPYEIPLLLEMVREAIRTTTGKAPHNAEARAAV